MSAVQVAILYNVAIVLIIWGGALAPLLYPQIRSASRIVISFSSGIFLGVAFIDMIPEAIDLIGVWAGGLVVVGFLAFYILERFIMVHPCEETHCDFHHIGWAAFLGLSFHSLMNGVALGSSLLLPGIGFAVFLATLFHKLPESFSLTSLLVLGNRTPREVAFQVLAFSIMVPVGTLFAFGGLAPMGEKALGGAVAVSAGIFLQMATGDLLAEAHGKEERRYSALIAMLIGVVITLIAKKMEG